MARLHQARGDDQQRLGHRFRPGLSAPEAAHEIDHRGGPGLDHLAEAHGEIPLAA